MKIIRNNVKGNRGLDGESSHLMQLVQDLRYPQIETVARKILARDPRHALAWRALTFAQVCVGRYSEAVTSADRALRFHPDDGEVHNNRAIALSMLMRWDEAVENFLAALRHAPADPEIFKNLGCAYLRMRRWNDAVPAFLKAIEYHPGDYVEAIAMLASALTNANRYDEAAACIGALCNGDPTRIEYVYERLALDLRRCAWGMVPGDADRLGGELGRLDRPTASPWWMSWFWFVTSADQLNVARAFASEAINREFLESRTVLPMTWRPGTRRLRIGYFSADFRNHAVSVVIAELLERHDRARVEAFAYSLAEGDGSPLRNRVIAAVEHFVDMAAMSVHETAERIRSDGIDILIDLTGWMSQGRVESLVLRCAPIQAGWLGYPGTLGHPNITDYIIGDPVVTPLSDQPFYAEEIAQLPHSYMPVDTTRELRPAPTRTSQGLPENSFVICSFNNSYKFNPPLFDLWCRTLALMPDAVLWLPRHNDTVAENLRREFVSRGLEADRLILASRINSSEEHLARLQLADLALDTFPYNSHSTGVDVLWAGVPLVAKRGDTFAGRVGASLLCAAGLPELIANDDDQYAAIVLDLYRDRCRLAEIKKRLIEARTTAPLFDMRRMARDLEDLYFKFADRAISRPD